MNYKVPALLFMFSVAYSQSPVSNFVNHSETIYAIVDSTNPLDENTSGSELTWDFTTLSQIGTNTDTNTSPTSDELDDFPNTTEVLTSTTSGTPPIENKLFIRDNAAEISLTGATQNGNLILEFTDNAVLGTFPLNFNDANSDDTSGNFSGEIDGTNISGTFSGTLLTSVDAYGTLTLNDFGLGAYNSNVTRLKTQLDISLNISVVNIGTQNQTGYYYCDDTDGRLVFRSSTNVIDINAFGNVVNETVIVYEVINQNALSTNDESHIEKTMNIYPNPATNSLRIDCNENIEIRTIEVLDLGGRIFNVAYYSNNIIDISHLTTGLYLILIHTDTGVLTKKVLKK